MGSYYMESTQINYRRDETLKTVDQKLQELSETSAIDTDIAPVFKSTNTYAPGDMVYYRNKLYVFNVEHTGAWAAADVTATDVTTEISSLKSGLTNVADDAKLNTQDLTTGSRTKNLLPITVSGIKEENTTGTWDGDTYTESGVSFAIQKDSDGKVTGITANGTASNETYFVFAGNDKLKALAGNNLILNGSIGGATETYLIQAVAYNGVNSTASRDGDSVTFTPTSAFRQVRVLIANGVSVDHVNFYPMIRLATETDDTFVPYIPSVESRIEAVESGLTNISKGYYTQNMTTDKWYKICDISASSWSIHYSLLALNGFMLKAVTFRYDANQQSYNNNLTAIHSVYGEKGYIGMKFSGNTATLYVRAANTSTASVTYSVLSDGGNSTANYCTPIETAYTASDMDYIEPTT